MVPIPQVLDAPGGPPRYYEALGTGCDWLLRCHDCRALVTLDTIRTKHACHKCGCGRMREVTALSFWEWLRIRTGLLDFPHRKAFLAEFGNREPKR